MVGNVLTLLIILFSFVSYAQDTIPVPEPTDTVPDTLSRTRVKPRKLVSDDAVSTNVYYVAEDSVWLNLKSKEGLPESATIYELEARSAV